MWFSLLLLVIFVVCMCFFSALLFIIFGRGSSGSLGAHPLSDPPQTSLEHDKLIAVVSFAVAAICLPLHLALLVPSSLSAFDLVLLQQLVRWMNFSGVARN